MSEFTYVVFIHNHFGIGTTIKEAQKRCASANGYTVKQLESKHGKGGWTIWQMPKNARDIKVDCFGRIHWTNPPDNLNANPTLVRGEETT